MREGQIVRHKISKEDFVIIKFRCLAFSIFAYGTFKRMFLCSTGKHSSDNYDIYENELRELTEKEIKKLKEGVK